MSHDRTTYTHSTPTYCDMTLYSDKVIAAQIIEIQNSHGITRSVIGHQHVKKPLHTVTPHNICFYDKPGKYVA